MSYPNSTAAASSSNPDENRIAVSTTNPATIAQGLPMSGEAVGVDPDTQANSQVPDVATATQTIPPSVVAPPTPPSSTSGSTATTPASRPRRLGRTGRGRKAKKAN